MTTGFFTSHDGALCRTHGAPITVREHYAHTHQTIDTGREFRETLRAGAYAWPGGYPLYFITSDGAALQRMIEVFDGPGGTDSPACVAARAAIARAKGQP
jgi:hypothetical protein